MPPAGSRRRSRRCFVAVELPPEVHRALEAAAAPWRSVLAARWVPAASRHITLRFLGPVDPSALEGIGEALTRAARGAGPIDTRLTGLGAFPSLRSARVLWAGVDDRPGRLATVALALDAALAPAFPPQTRAFRPHVTLARCDPPLRLPEGYATTPVDPVAVRVDRVTLFESVTGRGGPVYEPLARADLTG